MNATEHDYLVMDVADLPPQRAGKGDKGDVQRFVSAIRSLPDGKALFVPLPEGAIKRTFQVLLSGRLKVARLVGKTRFDYDRNGFWVWLEAKS